MMLARIYWPAALLAYLSTGLTAIGGCRRAPTARESVTSPHPASSISEELRGFLSRGTALSLEGKQDSALAVYQEALSQWPDEYRVHAGLGTILDLLRRFDEARRHWSRAITLAPPEQRPGMQQQLAISYAFECRTEDAARAERSAIDTRLQTGDFAGAAAVYNEQARIYLECNDPIHALSLYRLGYETALRSPVLTDTAKALWAFRWEHAQARIAARQGQPSEAREHVAAASRILEQGLNPDQLRFLPYLTGYVAFFAGDYGTAITELRRADQTDPFVLSLIARALEKQDNQAEARTYWNKAYAVNGHGLTVAFSRLPR